MMGLVYIIGAIVLLGVACYFYDYRRRRDKRPVENSEPDRIDTECCGQHLICEKESLLAGASREIVYYDDEELDRYAGRPSPGEVAGWIRSLQLRDISLPDALKAEVVLVIEEQRRQSARN